MIYLVANDAYGEDTFSLYATTKAEIKRCIIGYYEEIEIGFGVVKNSIKIDLEKGKASFLLKDIEDDEELFEEKIMYIFKFKKIK